MRLGAALLALHLLLVCAPRLTRAQEHAYVHVVRSAETLASIAQAYYGDPKRADVLIAENGLPDELEGLSEGLRLVIPLVRYHRVAAGESWRSIAERYYADPSRASALLRAHHHKASAVPEEGAQLLIPYPLRHVVRSTDTLQSIAARYYGGRADVKLLRAFNGGRSRVARGQIVLVPLFDLLPSRAGIERLEHATVGGTDAGEAQRVQDEVQRAIPGLREHVQAGRFVEAAALGNELLGRGQLTGNQEISIQRELATAYVALGREDLAIATFVKALAKQPDLELDSVRTSPRVLHALAQAKAQRAK